MDTTTVAKGYGRYIFIKYMTTNGDIVFSYI